ncbi:MAG: hypothetical protein LUQ50_06810 [Methanospirillum sp.]|uniref:hypothetical protein n=1 Tax=Methanospirillum sp. TaxID=45200 RepID=UPI00236A41D6|nr:hypothetical protein [Methanospirillum sp.]MDD1728765.1 hypothetical protein [Methanospirillum sp.]
MTLRNAGLLRKLPDGDDLFFTVDGTMARVRGVDIPRILTGQEKPIYSHQEKVGTIVLSTRPGCYDRIIVNLHGLAYFVWCDQFEKVWNGAFKWARIYERVPDCWQGFSQGVTA